MKAIFTTICVFVSLITFSQQRLSGNVYDKKTKAPIPYADVVLLKGDKVQQGIATNDKGEFSFSSLNEGSYRLRVTYLGFKDFNRQVLIKKGSNEKLEVLLEPNIEELNEIVIRAEKTTIEFFPDKKVVNVGKDILSAGADTEEILRQIPSVDVDINGTVSLRDDPNVIILIDGKRSTLSSSDVIAQIPSNLIEKIEVITSPSAKYDAEGSSGLINIITKKFKIAGGNLNATIGIAEDNRNNLSLNGNYKSGKINFYVNYNYRKNFFKFDGFSLRSSETTSIQQRSITTLRNGISHYSKTGIDYSINDKEVISASAIFSDNSHIPTITTNTLQTNLVNGDLISRDFLLKNSHKHVSNVYNLNYRNEFKKQDHYLELDANFAHFPNTLRLDSEEQISNQDDVIIDNRLDVENKITTLSADYHLAQEKKSILEAGVKAEFKDLDNFQNRTRISTNTSRITDRFIYKDRVLAAYITYQKKIENLTIKSGLRVEDYQIDLNSNQNLIVEDSYLSLFPSLSMSLKLGKNEITGSYSRRITRPRVFALNPFPLEQNNLSLIRGNPFLLPSFSNQYEINYNRRFKKFSFNISTFYNRNNDVIRFININEGNAIVGTFNNIGTSERYGLEIFSRINWFSWWNSNISLNFYRSRFQTTQFANNIGKNQRYNFRNSFNFKKGWSFQLNSQFNPSNRNIQQEIKGFYVVDFAFSKSMFLNKGLFTFRLSDVFRTRIFDITRVTGIFSEEITNRVLTSRFISITYRHLFSFGKNVKNRNRQRRQYINGAVN